MKKNYLLLIVVIIVTIVLSFALVQAATNAVQADPVTAKYRPGADSGSLTIGPIGPEADPYLEHLRGIIGTRSAEPTVDSYQQGYTSDKT